MNKLWQKVLKSTLTFSLVITVVVTSISLVGLWLLADDVATPKRRAIQPYHQQILNHPENEGISITAYQCADGNAPCLFITPHKNLNQRQPTKIAKRAKLVREQLQRDFGREMLPYADTVKKPKGIVVLLHGRHGRKEDLLPVAIRMVASGFVCVLIDLPNHGDSPVIGSRFGTELKEGNPDSNNPDFISQSLLDMRHWLKENRLAENKVTNTDKLPAFLWGMSMGGSYANHAVGFEKNNDETNWKGLIIVSSFSDMQLLVDTQANNLIKTMPTWIQPIIKPVLLSTFDSFVEWQGGVSPAKVTPSDYAKTIKIPVLQFHGTNDKVIPYRQGQLLHNRYVSNDKRFITVEGAGHNDILVTDYPVYATMADWMLTISEAE